MRLLRDCVPIFISLLLVSFLLLTLSPLVYPFSSDGSFYIQQAQNFLTGRGFSGTPFALSHLNLEIVPSSAFPPGYPMLIAAISFFGVPLRIAATAVSWGAWVLLGGVLAFALIPLTGRMIAWIVALLTVLSPGAFEFGYLAGADLPFLLFVALSVGLLYRSFTREAITASLILSGFFAGFAYLIRNAGIVLFPAAGIMYLIAWQFRYMRRPDLLRRGCLWFVGAAVVCLPLAIRNLWVFGRVQPYIGSHHDSDFSALHSLRTYLWSLVLDLSGSVSAAEKVWDRWPLLLVGVPVIYLLIHGVYQYYRRGDVSVRLCLIWAGCYIVFGSAMVIVGRATFDWVETSLLRHVIQYSWLILAAVFIAIRELLLSHKLRWVGLLLVTILLTLSRAGYLGAFIEKEKLMQAAFLRYSDYPDITRAVPDERWVLSNQLLIMFSHDRKLLEQVARLPAQSVIVSNYGKLLTLETGRPVRELPLDDLPSQTFVRSVEKAAGSVSTARPFFWALMPTNRVLRTRSLAAWQDGIIEISSNSFSVAARSPSLLLLKYRGKRE